jgi:Terminase RNaseH-like domain
MPIFSVDDYALTKQPDFHPEDRLPDDIISSDILPAPTRNGKLLVPLHWGKIWGIDFGISHPFAAVLAAWDRDSDVVYILKTVKMANTIPEAHAAAMLRIDSNAPIAWPHDGNKRESDGETLAAQYKACGLHMLGTHATFPDGGFSTEAAVMEMDRRMQTGRFRVCEDLVDWWEEYRLYHRKDGQIVKIDDDLLSATQKIIMMKRFAKNGPIGFMARKPEVTRQPQQGFGFDLFTGQPFPY